MKTTVLFRKAAKWVFSGVLLLCASTYTHSQSVITIGPRLGGTLSWFNNLPHVSPQPNLTGGAFIMYSQWEHVGFSADVLYAGRGAYYKFPAGGERPDIIYNRRIIMHDLEVPLLFNYFINGTSHRIRPRLMLGPSVNFLLYGKTAGEGSPRDPSFSQVDYSIVAGAGVNINLRERMWLTVDARYNHSLVDMNQTRRIIFEDPIYSRTVGVMVGLGFGIGNVKPRKPEPPSDGPLIEDYMK